MDTIDIEEHEVLPDYSKSVVNLSSTLISFLGGSPVNSKLPEALEKKLKLKTTDTVVMFVVDGLGQSFLKRHQSSFLYSHSRAKLSACFPSSTTPSLTSIFTGLTPAQTGMLAWITPGSPSPICPLRYQTADRQSLYAQGAPEEVLGFNSCWNTVPTGRLDVIQPDQLVGSPFSLFLFDRWSRTGYRSLKTLKTTVLNVVAANTASSSSTCPGLVMVYLPELDHTRHGKGDDMADAVFKQIDSIIAAVAEKLPPRTRLVVTADHGLVLTDPQVTLPHLPGPDKSNPRFYGEGRLVFCDPGLSISDIPSDTYRELTDDQLIELIGPGPLHPRLSGTLPRSLLARGRAALMDGRLANMIMLHGGLHEEEMIVPLIVK
eukprot:gnl/Dysnectes_brevis/2571_a3097_640.p1 GENE.gnl/Dysnectes_brevis/2571_a3097_640~~gnl/Dysnectes_brevis/2571_a3097_640.p1  ORF type:complete len:375 (+),score=61.11 gnl/Dysnectes_brevis/2571_a3097_640:1721-2845(+)